MTEKPASTKYPLHDLLQRRWSPRSFNGQPIAKESLTRLFEAARWAPSRNNQQPWYFIVAQRSDKEAFQQMISCLKPGNQRWAGEAGALAVAVVRLVSPGKGPFEPFMYDVGLAVGQLCMQAEAEQLRVHQMGGIERELIRETFAIPDGHNPLVGLAIGYEGDASTLPEDLLAREAAPRERRPLHDIVFADSWGNTADFAE